MLLLLIGEVEGCILLAHNSNSVLGSCIEVNVAFSDCTVNLAFVAGPDYPLFVARFQHF